MGSGAEGPGAPPGSHRTWAPFFGVLCGLTVLSPLGSESKASSERIIASAHPGRSNHCSSSISANCLAGPKSSWALLSGHLPEADGRSLRMLAYRPSVAPSASAPRSQLSKALSSWAGPQGEWRLDMAHPLGICRAGEPGRVWRLRIIVPGHRWETGGLEPELKCCSRTLGGLGSSRAGTQPTAPLGCLSCSEDWNQNTPLPHPCTSHHPTPNHHHRSVKLSLCVSGLITSRDNKGRCNWLKLNRD